MSTTPPYSDLGFAKVDHDREARWGMPESVLGLGKTPEQIAAIVAQLARHNRGTILVTRTDRAAYGAVVADAPDAEFHETASLIRIRRGDPPAAGPVAVVSAGTSDVPVAEEAALTAEAGGATVDRIYDVGVAGIHRVLDKASRIAAAECVVVVAGMEGALPTVVAGLTGRPVVAVPTSIGYGASLGGLAALLAMLNSCAPQVVCVNVDNGFGAGFFAALVTRRAQPGHGS